MRKPAEKSESAAARMASGRFRALLAPGRSRLACFRSTSTHPGLGSWAQGHPEPEQPSCPWWIQHHCDTNNGRIGSPKSQHHTSLPLCWGHNRASHGARAQRVPFINRAIISCPCVTTFACPSSLGNQPIRVDHVAGPCLVCSKPPRPTQRCTHATECSVLVTNFSRFGVSERALWHFQSLGKKVPRSWMWKVGLSAVEHTNPRGHRPTSSWCLAQRCRV